MWKSKHTADVHEMPMVSTILTYPANELGVRREMFILQGKYAMSWSKCTRQVYFIQATEQSKTILWHLIYPNSIIYSRDVLKYSGMNISGSYTWHPLHTVYKNIYPNKTSKFHPFSHSEIQIKIMLLRSTMLRGLLEAEFPWWATGWFGGLLVT